MKAEKMAQIILEYLEINYSNRVNSCCDDTYYTCGRYSINPEHLAHCIKEYNSKDSKEVRKGKMWYKGDEGDGEGWLRAGSACV